MKVALVTCVFPPEHTFSATTGAETAEELVRQGHAVHVYAPFPNHPKGRLFEGYKRALYSSAPIPPGYPLTHCFGTFSRSSRMLSRFVSYLTFGITSGLHILFGERPDVIYTNSWPIFANGVVALVARLRRVPLVLRVNDVYPESLESQRRVSSRNWIYRAIRRIDRMIARASEQILVISPVFQQIYVVDRGIQPQKVHVVPNWGNDEVVDADPSSSLAFRKKMAIPEAAFLAVYAGNVGVASGAETLVEALSKLKHLEHVYLVIAGEGSQLAACREQIARQHLDRVLIHSPWKTEETQAVLQMADVLLLPTKARQSLISVPSKLISYFLAARPVIAAVLPESDTATATFESGAGWVIGPDSSDQMAAAISSAAGQSKDGLIRMGSAGRSYALENLSRSSNLPRVIRILETASGLRNESVERQESETLYQ